MMAESRKVSSPDGEMVVELKVATYKYFKDIEKDNLL